MSFQEYITNNLACQRLVGSVRKAFLNYPAFYDALDNTLSEICLALSAEKALVTGWERWGFRAFKAFGLADVVPTQPPNGKLAALAAAGKPGSLFGSDIKEFGGVAQASAVNGLIWVRDSLQAVLSLINVQDLTEESDRLNGLVQEIATELGREFERSLGFVGLSQKRLDSGEYSLAYLLRRGTKWVAILFADIRGSTPMCEILGLRSGYATNSAGRALQLPQPAELINQCCDLMANAICVHGRVEKFTGDGVMGIIGDLIEEPNDQKIVLRASCTATKMYDSFQGIVQTWKETWIPDFQKRFNEEIDLKIGIGINFGPAFFDFYGSIDHKEYSAIGDTANSAQRLEELASRIDESGNEYEPILISQTMFVRAQDFIKKFERHVVSVRGKAYRIPVYGVKEFDREKCKCSQEKVQCSDCPGGIWQIS
jgi:class 3 adenylate cyclase